MINRQMISKIAAYFFTSCRLKTITTIDDHQGFLRQFTDKTPQPALSCLVISEQEFKTQTPMRNETASTLETRSHEFDRRTNAALAESISNRSCRSANDAAWAAAGVSKRKAPKSPILSKFRLKPSFLIIGAQKAGTTSLYSYLVQHPRILSSTLKEVHYFDTADYEQGAGWYLSHFPGAKPLKRLMKPGPSECITGEASPYYLAHPATPERVKSFRPDTKLIVMLRDPISRAFSHYNHQVRHGRENLSFEDALKAESARLSGEREKMEADPTYYSYNYWLYSYVERGMYARQLKHWLNYFPLEQFMFIDSTDFFSSPKSVYSQTLEFLGVPELELASAPKKNAGDYAGMTDSAKRFLKESFREPNQQLNTLLDRSFAWSEK